MRSLSRLEDIAPESHGLTTNKLFSRDDKRAMLSAFVPPKRTMPNYSRIIDHNTSSWIRIFWIFSVPSHMANEIILPTEAHCPKRGKKNINDEVENVNRLKKISSVITGSWTPTANFMKVGGFQFLLGRSISSAFKYAVLDDFHYLVSFNRFFARLVASSETDSESRYLVRWLSSS